MNCWIPPKPPLELPTGDYAVVTYKRVDGAERHAVLAPEGLWQCYDTHGDFADSHEADNFAKMLNGTRVVEAKVIFKGVFKL